MAVVGQPGGKVTFPGGHAIPITGGGGQQAQQPPPSGTISDFSGPAGGQSTGTSAVTFRVGGASGSALNGTGGYTLKAGCGFGLFEGLGNLGDGVVTFTLASPALPKIICGTTGGAQTGGFFTTTGNGIFTGAVKNGSYEREVKSIAIALHAATVFSILTAGSTQILYADYAEFTRWTDAEFPGANIVGLAADAADITLLSIVAQTPAQFAATIASYPLLPHGTADNSAVPPITGINLVQYDLLPPVMAGGFVIGHFEVQGGVGPFSFNDFTVPGVESRYYVLSHGAISTYFNAVGSADDTCSVTVTDAFGQTFSGSFPILKNHSGDAVMTCFCGSPKTFNTNLPNPTSNDLGEAFQSFWELGVFGPGFDPYRDPLTISPTGQFIDDNGPFRTNAVLPPGSYPLTLTRTGSGGSKSINVTLTCVAATPLPPLRVRLDPGFSTASLAGDTAFQCGMTALSNAARFQIVNGDGTYAVDAKTGIGRTTGPVTSGPASVDILVRDGLLARVDHYDFVVPVGQTLPASRMAFAPPSGSGSGLATNLDNGMATFGSPGPVLVGSVTLTSGMTAPTWSVDADGEPPLLTYADGRQGTFYAVPRQGNPLTVDIWARWLSGRTYPIKAIAREGTTLCVATTTLTVADLRGTGPVVTLTPGGSNTATTTRTWNEAMDAYQASYAAKKGMTVRLPGGVVPIGTDPTGIQDFNRRGSSGGSNRQFPPGPCTLSGPDDLSNPAILDLNGAPGLSQQGGIIAQGGDQSWFNLVIKHVAKGHDAGAGYKTGASPHDLDADACKFFNSEDGFLSGFNEVSRISFKRSVFAMCGFGDYGLTHNFYVGHAGEMVADRCLSFSNFEVHHGKSRARKSTLTNSTYAYGINGKASDLLDFPVFGKILVQDTVLHKGADNPQNGYMVQIGEESLGGNGPAWDVNEALLNRVTFLNTTSPQPTVQRAIGLTYMSGQTQPAVAPLTGKPGVIVMQNGLYYNMPRDTWWTTAVPGSPIVDGGNNHHLPEWPGLICTDPATGLLLAVKPSMSYSRQFIGQSGYGGILVDPVILAPLCPAMAAVGRDVLQMFAQDDYDQPLTGQVWSLPADPDNDGSFKIDTMIVGNTMYGMLRALASNMPDSLRWALVRVTGTDSHGVAQTYLKRVFVVVGTGYCAPRDTAGGPVVAA